MDAASNITSNPFPPSYEESQRQAQSQGGQAGARSVEAIGDAVFKCLRDGHHLPNPFIKAVLEHAIKKLPEGTVSYTSDSVKKSAFEKLVELIKKKIGDAEFELIANNVSSTVSNLDLGEISSEIDVYLSPNETAYFAKTFLETSEFEQCQGSGDLGYVVAEVLMSKHCNMSVSNFLARLNPEFCDIESLSLSENA